MPCPYAAIRRSGFATCGPRLGLRRPCLRTCFSPSVGIRCFQTCRAVGRRSSGIFRFNPSVGIRCFQTRRGRSSFTSRSRFQSLSRDSMLSDWGGRAGMRTKAEEFQSLSRDSMLSDAASSELSICRKLVSIPQSGFDAFRHHVHRPAVVTSAVSIPQSGFDAFRPHSTSLICIPTQLFQSLSRDSMLSDQPPLSPRR